MRLEKTRSFCLTSVATVLIFFLPGCHSAYVETTIENRSTSDIHLVEVDYPSASFGVGTLAANKQFHYRFKIQGSGALKIEFTDPQGKVQTADGPELSQGQEGRLNIIIDPAGKVSWQPNLSSAK